MDPSAFNAANAEVLENTFTIKLNDGSLTFVTLLGAEPPLLEEPQAVMDPSTFNAANAEVLENTFTIKLNDGSVTSVTLLGAEPPLLELPQADNRPPKVFTLFPPKTIILSL